MGASSAVRAASPPQQQQRNTTRRGRRRWRRGGSRPLYGTVLAIVVRAGGRCGGGGEGRTLGGAGEHFLVVEDFSDVLLDPVVVEQLAHQHAAVAGGAHLLLQAVR